jgi:hypothetical protein
MGSDYVIERSAEELLGDKWGEGSNFKNGYPIRD